MDRRDKLPERRLRARIGGRKLSWSASLRVIKRPFADLSIGTCPPF
jgi:hypothetical protein